MRYLLIVIGFLFSPYCWAKESISYNLHMTSRLNVLSGIHFSFLWRYHVRRWLSHLWLFAPSLGCFIQPVGLKPKCCAQRYACKYICWHTFGNSRQHSRHVCCAYHGAKHVSRSVVTGHFDGRYCRQHTSHKFFCWRGSARCIKKTIHIFQTFKMVLGYFTWLYWWRCLSPLVKRTIFLNSYNQSKQAYLPV